VTEQSRPANASTALATVLVDELVRGGVRHAVLAPGSRSAALGFALHRAHAAGLLTLHTRIDERSAAFLALGLARTSRSPVPVVTTSGTAVANLHPAVLEASHTGLPLLLLTADRPAALRGTQANQTTDQVNVFGTAVRLAADVPAGHAGDETQQVAAWRALAARAVGTAHGAAGTASGPVHLNLQMAEPLTPEVSDGWAGDLDGRPDRAPWTRLAEATRPTAAVLENDRRTVVVAGDDAGPPARILAEQAGWPLLAEPTSGSRTGRNAIRTYRLLLGAEDLACRIERVVVCGHPTLSRPVSRLLARPDVEVVAVANRTGWSDPGHRVSRVVAAAEAAAPLVDDARRADAPGETTRRSAWLEEWLRRDAELGRRLDALLAAEEGLTPHEVAGAVSAALPARGLLFVGASNPVRDLDLMVARYRVGDRRLVIGNRGLAGIDGSVSTAVGAALGRPGTTRAFALMGDVTFLHDTNGLLVGPDEHRPDLTIVVVNDDGGSIFASLEQGGAEHATSFEKLFGTPHGVDLASLCAATRTPHWKVQSLEELRHALASPAGGIEVVEAVVRRDNRRDLDARIRALVTAQP
jgi:2-succinyl-5-enolpyruvyl-6-hydroxy-3-cyclohexene-1-carboxylate synthase